MTIAETLRDCRGKAGFSRAKLARLAEISAGTLFQYEQGLRIPQIAQLCRLADALGVTVDYLAYGLTPGQYAAKAFKRLEACARGPLAGALGGADHAALAAAAVSEATRAALAAMAGSGPGDCHSSRGSCESAIV
jgi:transcriptional regulator with XRE-family HTH domain